MNTLKLYLDTTGNRLVTGPNAPTPYTPAPFAQGDVIPIVLFLLEQSTTGTLVSPFSYVNDANVTVKLGLVTPGAASSTVHCSATLTYVAGSPASWQGTLTLGAAVTSFLGSSDSKSCKLEVELTDTATNTISTELQLAVTVIADGLKAGSAPADPAPDRYPTVSETNATYAKRLGLPGEAITLRSANGTYSAVLYVDNNGVLHTDVQLN